MSFRYSDNELDNALFTEVNRHQPDEQRIHELIAQGANINAVNKFGESVLMSAVENTQFGLDIKYIQLVISLGADINYTNYGFNCLFEGINTRNPEVVELLLKAGAYPNCVDEDETESILDNALSDLCIAEHLNGRLDELEKIVQLLKDHGAKTLWDIDGYKPQ